jgi:hypothetical protein
MDSKKKKNLEESYERILNVGFCKVPYEICLISLGPIQWFLALQKMKRSYRLKV